MLFRKRLNFEGSHSEAVNPERVATHFARLRAVIYHSNILDPSSVSNFDESGFSIRGMTLGERAKCIVLGDSRVNTRELKFRRTFDYVTVMPVVSATGQVLTQVIVLPGMEA